MLQVKSLNSYETRSLLNVAFAGSGSDMLCFTKSHFNRDEAIDHNYTSLNYGSNYFHTTTKFQRSYMVRIHHNIIGEQNGTLSYHQPNIAQIHAFLASQSDNSAV